MCSRLSAPSGRGGGFSQPFLHLLAEYCTILHKAICLTAKAEPVDGVVAGVEPEGVSAAVLEEEARPVQSAREAGQPQRRVRVRGR